MKIFISWSGEASRSVAEALRDWIPMVIQGVTPFVSAKDIDKGERWATRLMEELEESRFGIVCVTRENLQSPWLNFEAGAISSSINSRTAPVLFRVPKNEIPAPISQLQLTSLKKDDIKQLMRSIGKAASSPLTDGEIDETVDRWWTKLEGEIEKISDPSEAKPESSLEPDKPEMDIEGTLKEILVQIRQLNRRYRNFEAIPSRDIGGAVNGIDPNATRYILRVADNLGISIKNIELSEGLLRISCGGVVSEKQRNLFERKLRIVAKEEGVSMLFTYDDVAGFIAEEQLESS